MSSFFSPFKRHAKSFNYKPRFYDPQKEEREQRRAELSGERRDNTDGGEEYVPGQYLRTQFEARAQRREKRQESGQKRTWSLIVGIALIFIVIALLYPRLVGIFTEAQQRQQQPRPTKTELESEYGDFDPYAPITIVPNDYEEEQSE